MRIHTLLHASAQRLEAAGVDTAELDARLLLCHCLGKSQTELYLMAGDEIESCKELEYLELLRLREQRQPLAYITGSREFWSMDFLVGPDVLIPRPETELLVEKALSVWKKQSSPRGLILDLCTGSGIIAIVLAKELGRPVIAIDLSMEALLVARQNAKLHGVDKLVTFVRSDLLSAIRCRPCFSLAVSNPPYISSSEMAAGLQPEVDRYEPHLALDGGEKGLETVKKISRQLLPVLLPGASLLMEIGTEQGDDVLSIFAAAVSGGSKYCDLDISRDYSGHDRILYGKLKINSDTAQGK